MSVLESVFDKVADLELYKKKRFHHRNFKESLHQTLPVATFGYSIQSRIFQEITTLKFQGQHAPQSNFCRHEGLSPATKTEIHRCWFRWNFKENLDQLF